MAKCNKAGAHSSCSESSFGPNDYPELENKWLLLLPPPSVTHVRREAGQGRSTFSVITHKQCIETLLHEIYHQTLLTRGKSTGDIVFKIVVGGGNPTLTNNPCM